MEPGVDLGRGAGGEVNRAPVGREAGQPEAHFVPARRKVADLERALGVRRQRAVVGAIHAADVHGHPGEEEAGLILDHSVELLRAGPGGPG
jgi:hypothetical protein